jgi:hypothetical protein
MTKTDEYRRTLRSLADWKPYLMQASGLPGPRGNLELAQVVAEEGERALFEHLLTYAPEIAPVNTPQGFLAFCGVVGLGRLLAEGDVTLLPRLRIYASDPRWRIREAVAMALQRLGKANMPLLLAEMEQWSSGTWLEKRAAAAALAEPVLLKNEAQVRQVLAILDKITVSMLAAEPKNADFKVLQKGMEYCWSVAVAAAPSAGKPLLEKWLACPEQHIQRMMRENLRKKRLLRMDAAWVNHWLQQN